MFVFALMLMAGAPAPDPVDLLARSDELHDRAVARQDAALLVDALELLAQARGHVFAPGGAAVDIGYDARRAEALRAAGDDARLLVRIAALPDADRGAVDGGSRARQNTDQGGAWSRRISFRAEELASVYARSHDGRPLTLTVRIDGKTRCREHRASGRAICLWRQKTAHEALIEVAGPGGMGFDIVTN